MIKPSGADFKAEYAQYVSKATQLIHTPEVQQSIIQILSGDNPVQKVASAVVMVMQRMDQAARKTGIEVQDSVKVYAANQIVGMIVDIGTAAKKLKLDKNLVELALSTTIQDYVKAEVAAGRIDRQKLAVKMQADLRTMPPKLRKEAQESMARIQETARKYNEGKGSPVKGGGMI